ncbi:MAG: insulinase family protein [Deltaproteobacteria bacterium]|nr:insulinase family protein [Deltaproteobacteria bacterium]
MVQKTTLPNGIRIVTETLPYLYSVSVGIWVENGSRDESPAENGISHFIEHMIFKGTRNRTALEIAKEMDAIGGMSNAFTSKEQTCFYTRVLENHLEQGVRILLDIFLNSLFDPEELERERQVVLQEISMVEDTPDEYTHVLLGETAYHGNSLAQPILGTPETVQAITQERILDYLGRSYGPEKIVVAAAGKVDHETFVDLVAPELNKISPIAATDNRRNPVLSSKSKTVSKDLEQVHLAWATKAPAAGDPKRYVSTLMNVIMGGNMSSRLFQEVREKRGLAYSIYSFLSSYRDSGMWGIYTAIAKETLTETLKIIGLELQKLKKGELSSSELSAAKEFVKGGILLGAESSDNRMTRIAKNEILFGRDLSFEEILRDLEKVTPTEVVDLADEILQPDQFSLVSLGPLTEGDLPSPAIALR